MPRSFAKPPRFEYSRDANGVFECQFVASQTGGVMVEYRISGKVAFPEKRGPQPKVGDVWQCKIAGENPAHSVFFVTCLKFISSTASRQAEREAKEVAAKVKEDVRKVLWDSDEAKFNAAWSEVEKVLAELLTKPVTAAVELSGGVKLELQSESLQSATIDPREGATLTLKQYVKLSLGTYFRPYVDGCIYTAFVGWEGVAFSDTYIKPDAVTRTVSVAAYVRHGDSSSKEIWVEYPAMAKAPYRETWPLDGGSQLVVKQDIVFVTPLGEMKKTLSLFENPDRGFSEATRWTPEAIAMIEAVKAEIKAAEEARTQKANANQNIKWLAVEYWVWELLLALGVPGLAKFELPQARHSYDDNPDRWAVFEEDHFIDPQLADLVKMVQPRPNYSYQKAEAKPWGYHAQVFELTGQVKEKFAPVIERRWSMMSFPNGQFDAKKLAEILAKTKEVVVPLKYEQFTALMEERQGRKQQVRIICRDTGQQLGQYGKRYNFDAAIKLPHTVDVEVDCQVEGLIIRLAQKTEEVEYVVKEIANGNEPFEGVVEAEPVLLRFKRAADRWSFAWTAPLSAEEVSKKDLEALASLSWYLEQGDTRISGYRYTDTGNPVVLVKNEIGWYGLCELIREEMRIEKRKGAGSNACSVRSMTTNEIRRALEDDYRDHFGWPVVRDPKLPMGKRLKDYLDGK